MRSDKLGTKAWFDPVGLFVDPGTTVRWVVDANVHTATAYHPANGNRARRIPEGAEPWDSGYLVNPGDSFEVTLDVPGVYDYFCLPHERAGMVGRIVVGEATGIATLPPDAFQEKVQAHGWEPVPPKALDAFPPVQDILAAGAVRRKP
jgi:plastocyanin